MQSWSSFREAESSLLALRCTQRGHPTLGDEADHAFLITLAALPSNAHALARESGTRLGTHVYSRRYHEDTLTRGISILSDALSTSGLGALSLDGSFHRRARVTYRPGAELGTAAPQVRAALLEGILEGFLSEAFHCAARAKAAGDHASIQLELGEGRDVNLRRRELP